MKASGKRTYSMEKGLKNIPTRMSTKGSLCMEANLEKDNINSLMERYTQDHFIMAIVMGMGSSFLAMETLMKANGSLENFTEREYTNGKVDKNMTESM